MCNRQDVEWFSAIGHLSKISPELHMRDGAIHYKLYLLKLTMAVDNIVFRIIKGAL